MLPIRYDVDLSARVQHLVRVRMTVPAELANDARIVVPTWTPGSYVVRDYVHHLQSLEASAVDGTRLTVTPDGHTAFRLPSDLDLDVVLELEWYANQLTVRTNHVDDHHALLVPPATFPYVDGAQDHPCTVRIAPTEGHTVHGLLPTSHTDGDGTTTFEADDYLHLVDSAFEVGDLPSVEFAVGDVPHRWVHASHGGDVDLDRIADDVRAIAEQAQAVFASGLPIDSYTFLCIGADSDAGGGGLEHRDGSVLMLPVLTDATDAGVRRTRSLIAHEYLHLWNVKRLIPQDFVDLTLDRPVHTTSLWVAEGFTAYYDDVLPARAGLHTPREYLDALRDDHLWVQRTPGARRQSVAQASWHAWTGLYVRDENSGNVGTNYYTHGAVVAACLDLLIREETPDADGLDEAFRLLWQRFGHDHVRGYPTRGYTHDDVVVALNDAAGRDLGDFVADHVLGAEPPPLTDLLGTVGLRVEAKSPEVVRPDLGVHTSETDRGVVFAAVNRDGPAWRAGVTGGDRLIAIDGVLVGRGELERVLAASRAGDVVELDVARGSRILTYEVTLDDPLPEVRFVPVDAPDEAARTAFARWTGHPLSEV